MRRSRRAAGSDVRPAALGRRPNFVRTSVGGAFGVSVVSHAAIVLLVLFVTSRMPPPTSSMTARSSLTDGIVWIPWGDSTSGLRPRGGGSGSHDPAPARRAQASGSGRVTVAAAVQRSTSTVVHPEVPPRVELDALPTRSGLTELPGVIGAAPSASMSLGPGDGGLAGTGRGMGDGPGDGNGLGDGRRGGTGGGTDGPIGDGASNPRLIREVVPMYTTGAMQARVEGIVELQAIVRADGSVGDVWITRPLDRAFGLDQEAVRVVRLWRFVPAYRAGRPVDAIVPVEIRFSIR